MAATLVNLSGCYTHPCYTGWDDRSSLFAGGYLCGVGDRRSVGALADEWLESIGAGTPTPPNELFSWWKDLRAAFALPVYEPLNPARPPSDWHNAAFQLMVVADEVCGGLGFADNDSPLAQAVFFEYRRQVDPGSFGPPKTGVHLPHSLCWMVPPDEACVQPKVMTPQVGCTLRSFTHHLALLPTVGEVKTSWIFGRPPEDAWRHLDIPEHIGFRHRPLNLLLVPFPFTIGADCFHPDRPATGNQVLEDSDESGGNQHFFFRLTPNWLEDLGDSSHARALAVYNFLKDLIEQANKTHHTPPTGLVLPEFALDYTIAKRVAELLAEHGQLEFFISGFSGQADSLEPGAPTPGPAEDDQNGIAIFVFSNKKAIGPYIQHKHHRWKLDSTQVRNYCLDNRLNPSRGVYWWEKMTIRPRECYFVVFRTGACLTALDCEDLGRTEPVQQAIRAVGANLVICLLLDGAQTVQRWPHRYAMVLADDPGSSVLTLTSLGMIRRYPKQTVPYPIGLWKERDGGTRQVELGHGNHGVVLTLWPEDEVNFSMDGRSDQGTTVKLALSGVRQIRHDNPPAWAKYCEPGNL